MEPGEQLSVMTHHEVQPFTDFPATGIPLQNHFGALQLRRGLGRVSLGRELIQPAIGVFRGTDLLCHGFMVRKRYRGGGGPVSTKR